MNKNELIGAKCRNGIKNVANSVKNVQNSFKCG